MTNKILVSACLLGTNCKYSGGNNHVNGIERLNEKYEIIPFCPEVLGGLPIPREPIEYVNGKVIDKYGNDYKNNLELAKRKINDLLDSNEFSFAILKSKSPSCGRNGIYDGSFTKTLVDRDGFACELIKARGIKVYTENEIDKL